MVTTYGNNHGMVTTELLPGEGGLKLELYSEAYKNRCKKRLKEWNAPFAYWKCVDMYDVADDGGALFTCELCDCPKVRFVHVMRHEEYFEDVYVGCICAGIMDGDILAAKARDREMKNRAKRKRNYLKRQWTWRANGNCALRYKNRWITIMVSKYENGGFGVLCDNQRVWRYKGGKMNNFLTAVYAAFDLVDPPIGGQKL